MSSTPVWHGTSIAGYLLESVESDLVIGEDGSAIATQAYLTEWGGGAMGLVAAAGTHPTFSWLRATSYKITREEAGMAKAVVTYKGVAPSIGEAGSNRKLYSIQASTSSEPIETHPKFVSDIGGTYASPKHNAQFDPKTKKFVCFPVTEKDGTTPNPYAGVKNYLSEGFIYEETFTIAEGGSLGTLLKATGCINEPPSSPCLPTVQSGRTWMMVGGSVSQQGKGIKVTRRWRLSGIRGWDTTLYKYT